MRFTEEDDLIDIRKDNVFKAVFTKKTLESQGALTALISSLIDRKVSIVAIAANEPPIENVRDRQIRFDIACKTSIGELVNIEMCLYPSPYEPVKLEFYASKLFIGQDIRGADKTFDDLKESYQIAILADDTFFEDEEVFHKFEYYDSEH
ncbi:MAG: Rpn family recombination-promoting nuclease/putative transposase, partial [Treponema sp.]|nr:Rpn family recombination-promoting nuclease/putative transposase [Treponema sp.]